MNIDEEILIARITYGGTESYARRVGDDKLGIMNGDPIAGLVATSKFVETKDVFYLPPTPATKVVGIGKNYPERDSPGSVNNPTPSFFIMGPNAMIGHQGVIKLPHVFLSTLVEGELAVVMKQRAKNLTPDEVQRHILGYTIVNDLSGRDSSLETVPAAIKKSADGFAPVGPYLNLNPDIRPFAIETRIDGEVVQSGNTQDMISCIVECLCYITSIMTLEPYDIVSMGTPTPKPKLRPGQEVQVEIAGLGVLANTMVGHDE